MEKAGKVLLWFGILAALATPAFAETRTISWNPVTTYTDNTLIAPKTVSYTAYWTADPGLGTLRTLGTSLTTTSTTFDPDVQGMIRGGTVYFTAKSVLDTGEVSALSPAYSWIVPIVTPPVATLNSIAVSGPSSVNEGSAAIYTATATWSDGTTTSVSPTWSTTLGTISGTGLFTAPSVTANQTATIGATYTGDVTRAASVGVTVVNATATLSSIAISGVSSVNEGATATYTAAATWSDGTNTAVTPTWSTTLGTISASGLFTAPSVTANQTATIGATYTGDVTRTASVGATVVNAAATLTGIAGSGPSPVSEGSTGTYTATGTWDNGTTAAISPMWSMSTSYASINASGLLTAAKVTANQTVTVTAGYGGKAGTVSVTIADVPGAGPAAPKNVGITAQTSSSTTNIWRLNWDQVTSNWDGTSIAPGRIIRYTAYWTDDPALSATSLRPLDSLISGTTQDFDPSANGMTKNLVVYLTVRAILDTGEQSPLAAGLTWRVSNVGPLPPAKGKILKK